MVVAFVGFVGVGPKPSSARMRSGSAGRGGSQRGDAVHLPALVPVHLPRRAVHRVHARQSQFTAPLTGITAAVVGVIVNLAVFFAYHVLWPQGLGGHFEWLSALIGLGAAAAVPASSSA